MSSQTPTFVDRLASGVDNLVRIVAPSWAEQRYLARARAAVAEFTGGGFAPLQTDRLTGAVTGRQGTLDERLPWWDRLKMIALFDELVHEEPLFCALAGTLGYGPRARSETLLWAPVAGHSYPG